MLDGAEILSTRACGAGVKGASDEETASVPRRPRLPVKGSEKTVCKFLSNVADAMDSAIEVVAVGVRA